MYECVAEAVRNYVTGLPLGQMFSTRECLNFGRRSAVDQILYRMVKASEITRLSRGVFVILGPRMRRPSLHQILLFKAKAFGRRALAMRPRSPVRPLTEESCDQPAATDGATSSFAANKHRAYLTGRAPRKLALGDSEHGMTIRMLWEVGRRELTPTFALKITSSLKAADYEMLKRSCHIMPAWLANMIVWNPLKVAQAG